MIHKLCKYGHLYVKGVDYIHGEVMYGHKHGLIHEVDQQKEDMVRNYEAHIFVGQTKHVSCSMLMMEQKSIDFYA